MRLTRTWIAGIVALLAVVVVLLWIRAGALIPSGGFDRDAAIRDVLSEESEAGVRAACTACHVFPDPESLPREIWPETIRGMYTIARRRNVEMPVGSARAVAWYLLHAPDSLPPAPGRTDAGVGSVVWETRGWRPADAPAGESTPAVTHVQMARLFDGPGDDVLVSEVVESRIHALRSADSSGAGVVLGTATHPARLAVTDLDEDGDRDVVVAALGALDPTDRRVGSVVWLRRTGPETFEEVVLADGLGRVADVQAIDLNGDGRTDLLVAVFGWRENGELMWLENVDDGPDGPRFERRVLDPRSGFTDGRAVDLDGDGRLDVVGLLTQEFQQVLVYWAEEGGYRREVIFAAPEPDWGFSGLTVTDFTGDGLPDLVVTNGDALDVTLARPHHGVSLLENLGGGGFRDRRLTHMYGAHKAVPVDLDGDGLPGLVVAAYLPPGLSRPPPGEPESLVWLQRVGPTHLVRRVLKRDGVDHMTVAAGDPDGDGRTDLAVGWMDLGVVDEEQARRGEPVTPWVTLWMNRGTREDADTGEEPPVLDWSAAGEGGGDPGRSGGGGGAR